MKHLRAVICAIAGGLLATPGTAATIFVTSDADTGAGSFRAAIEEANLDASINAIVFRGTFDIVLGATVVYTGEQSLRIDGKGSTIDGGGGAFDLFLGSGGGDLELGRLTFHNGGANGIMVLVPDDALGAISVSLSAVTIANNALFGLLVDDLTNSSAAGVNLDIWSSRVIGNGLVAPDLDGVRVDEGGDGDIFASVHRSEFAGNGADGLELDESDAGDVVLIARRGSFDDNGRNSDDTDDGIDIDERADGDIRLNVAASTFDDNTDDGIGVDESGAGDLHLTLAQVHAVRNGDSAISTDEGDAGDFLAHFARVTADGNFDEGANMTEAGDGDFDGRFVASSFSFNEGEGIAVEQLDDGVGTLVLVNVALEDNSEAIDAEGVDVTEIP